MGVTEDNKTIIFYLDRLSDQVEQLENKVDADLLTHKTQTAKIRETAQILRSLYQPSLYQHDSGQQSSVTNQQYLGNDLHQQSLQETSNNHDVNFILNQQYGINQTASPPAQQSNLLLFQQHPTPLSVDSFNLIDFPLDQDNNYASALLALSGEPRLTTASIQQTSCRHAKDEYQYQQNINHQSSDIPLYNNQQSASASPSNTLCQLSQFSPIETLGNINNRQQQSNMRVTLQPLLSNPAQIRHRKKYDPSSMAMEVSENSAEIKRANASSSPLFYHHFQNQGASNHEGSTVLRQSNHNSPNYSDRSTPVNQGSQQRVKERSYTKTSENMTISDKDQEYQDSEILSQLSQPDSQISTETDFPLELLEVPDKRSIPRMIGCINEFIKTCYTEDGDNSCFEYVTNMAKTVCENYASDPEDKNHLSPWSRLSKDEKLELQKSIKGDIQQKHPQLVVKASQCKEDWFFYFLARIFWSKRSTNLRAKVTRAESSSRTQMTRRAKATKVEHASRNDTDDESQATR